MSMISEQVRELKKYADIMYHTYLISENNHRIQELLREAADTIETLSAKLAVANMEFPKRYYGGMQISEDSAIETILFHYNEMMGECWDKECLGYAMDVLKTLKKYRVANMGQPAISMCDVAQKKEENHR